MTNEILLIVATLCSGKISGSGDVTRVEKCVQLYDRCIEAERKRVCNFTVKHIFMPLPSYYDEFTKFDPATRKKEELRYNRMICETDKSREDFYLRTCIKKGSQ